MAYNYSSFSSNFIILIDVIKKVQIENIPLFYSMNMYINYILFNHQNDIIYVSNVCKLFIKIVSVNNVLFNYCGTCHINDAVICCFVNVDKI